MTVDVEKYQIDIHSLQTWNDVHSINLYTP